MAAAPGLKRPAPLRRCHGLAALKPALFRQQSERWAPDLTSAFIEWESFTCVLPSKLAAIGSADINGAAAVHGERHAGDEIGLVGGEEEGGIGYIPGGAHLVAQRHAGIALRRHLGSA